MAEEWLAKAEQELERVDADGQREALTLKSSQPPLQSSLVKGIHP